MLNPGSLLQSRYHIHRVLAQGGMGVVYLAQDARLGNRWVAIKENTGSDPRQFTWEANLLSTLAHPNLPKVSDYFVESATSAQYLVMEYTEGTDVTTLVQQRGAVSEQHALAWARQILDALTYLHTRQPPIIHRDLQPSNVRITPQGNAIVSDFGIAKQYVPGQATTPGARGVTPGFSPPEQYAGGTDQRSDLYALGATLYYALTGRVPPESVLLAAGQMVLVPPRQIAPHVSANTEAVILRAMQIVPAHRFQSAAEMKYALGGLVMTNAPMQTGAHTAPTQPRTGSTGQMSSAIIWAALGGVLACIVFMACILLFLFFKDPLLTAMATGTFTPTITATRTMTWTPTLTGTATQTQTSTPTLTATRTESPTGTPTLTRTATPTLTATPTEMVCVNPYPTEFVAPPNISPEMKQWITAEVSTWLWTSQLCIRRGACATVYWEAKPENLFKTVENPRYTLEERSADYPDVVLFTREVDRRGQLDVCPNDNTRYVLVYQSKHEKLLMWRHIIVLP